MSVSIRPPLTLSGLFQKTSPVRGLICRLPEELGLPPEHAARQTTTIHLLPFLFTPQCQPYYYAPAYLGPPVPPITSQLLFLLQSITTIPNDHHITLLLPHSL
ncbi:hypothetical protein PSTG_19295 [Puccinia striiformis f. sp. tritici PST-78]|uniref:Uncharacterized protein n=1 Tax=Puccinia striiformis f. sp. tritici PST-78 TaxID=1165861 RepID=A0A0L0UJW3_9BASI|nr:hypothetical protein PSTG_19295 [Puccinia striiformis f. sp. tritici PST-78]